MARLRQPSNSNVPAPASIGSTPPPTYNAATIGASLLNSARLKNPHSQAPMAAHGKLKRPNVITEDVGKEVIRHGDIYDIQSSPEKSGSTTRAPTNHAPTKVSRKKNAQEQVQGAKHAPSPPALPTKEKIIGKSKTSLSTANRIHKRPTHQISNQMKHSPRKKTHVIAEYDENDDITLRQLRTRQNDSNAQDVAKPQTNQLSMGRKPRVEVRIPVRRHSEQQPLNSSSGMSITLADSPKEAEKELQRSSRTSPSSEYQDYNPKKQVSHMVETSSLHQSSSSQSSPSQVEFYEEDTERCSSGTNGDLEDSLVHTPRTMEVIFQFLDQDDCSGKCQTNIGSTIRKICKQGRSALQDTDSTHVTVVSWTDEISQAIKHVNSNVHKEDRIAFKSDAYAYLFRSLARYLKSLYDWLFTRLDEVTESLDAMRVLVPFIRYLLRMRDAISQWKVPISQRHQGERIVKDVASNFIAPLRKVYSSYSAQLRRLEVADEIRNEQRKIREQVREEFEEEKRKLEAIASKQELRRRWQDLHIARMLCEPDPFRRRHLAIAPLECLEERDSNGLRFERVPVFKPRSSPLLHRVAAHVEERAWTDEETSALLEGVQRFSGPLLYTKIFQTYCRPGGILRDFTAANIVAKVSWIRSSWLKLQHEKVWETPEWVQGLPVFA